MIFILLNLHASPLLETATEIVVSQFSVLEVALVDAALVAKIYGEATIAVRNSPPRR